MQLIHLPDVNTSRAEHALVADLCKVFILFMNLSSTQWAIFLLQQFLWTFLKVPLRNKTWNQFYKHVCFLLVLFLADVSSLLSFSICLSLRKSSYNQVYALALFYFGMFSAVQSSQVSTNEDSGIFLRHWIIMLFTILLRNIK